MRPPKRYIWVTGFGRSGTKWLANLLAKESGGHFYHEPCIVFDKAAPRDPDGSKKWWIESRVPKIAELRERDSELWSRCDWYGEVNGLIRFHAAVIAEIYPTAPLLHLHRDGRDVVRSLMARQIYTPGGGVNNLHAPDPGDRHRGRWRSYTRFQKLCWFWQDGVNRVLPYETGRICFERMITDYGYFDAAVCAPAGFTPIRNSAWQAAVEDFGPARNATKDHVMPAYPDWPDFEKQQFWDICGHTMRVLGYD